MAPGSGTLPGHASRIFSVKFHPANPNVLISGGWDRTLKIYDVRQSKVMASIFGPQLNGDSLDVFDDMIVTGSNRNKDVMQIFSLSKHQLIQTFDYEVTKKDIESGFVLGAKFS
jgi:COMPASS component SWD3